MRLLSLLALFVLMPRGYGEDLRVTGRLLRINGQSDIPRGLFGVHATPLTPERVEAWGIESNRYITHTPLQGGPRPLPPNLPHAVECQWDRYQPALIVQHADWRERLRNAARKAAQRVETSDRDLVIEFWNEPYLNWGVRPGVNYDERFYKPGEPGDAMTLRYADAPLPHMRWTEQTVAIREGRSGADYLATRFMPPGTRPGDTWTWRNTAYRAEKRPWGRDITQKTFWPGLQNVAWYLEMLRVYAPALKAANPHAPLVAGWDFHLYQNGYAAWDDVHKPTLDAAAPWIDGYSEHHYGGDTRRVAASYEVAWAYMKTEHGRDIDFYNTEAGGDLDPERPGPAQPGYNTTSPDVRDRAAYTYMMRDVLHLLDKSPDKAAARAAHEAHHGKGIRTAFQMLKPLRGRLIESRSTNPEIWLVAALKGNRMTVALFNDARGPREPTLTLTAPRGTRIVSVLSRKPNADMRIQETRHAVEAPSSTLRLSTRLEKREAEVWVLHLEGEPDPRRRMVIQFPAKDILQPVPKDGSLDMFLSVPRNALEHATHARLRLVQSGFTPGEHELHLNGVAVDIRPGGIGIADVDIPPGAVKERNTVTIRRTPGSKGCTVNAVSLYLEQTDPGTTP